MEIPTGKILERLRYQTQLVTQTKEGIQSNIAVQRTHPDRLQQAIKYQERAVEYQEKARDIILQIGVEDEVGAAHWDEISEALEVLERRLGTQEIIEKNRNLFIATNRKSLANVFGLILRHSIPVFQQMLEEMTPDDFASIEDVLDRARLRRS